MTISLRPDGRSDLELRPVSVQLDTVPHAEGSCLYVQGRTRVHVTASVEDKIPPFLRDTGEGWITAEYGMLPRATSERSAREAARGKQSGRTLEIQRLIGRALRGVVDRRRMPDLTITLDCDVLVADAGTRCASVTGACIALALALAGLEKSRKLRGNPLREAVAGISVGLRAASNDPLETESNRRVLLDLDYLEDSTAAVDLNLVSTSHGRFVEIQGTAEREPFGDESLARMLAAGRSGLAGLFAAQRTALAGRVPDEWLEAIF
jgi:ribonuclease PH